MVVYVLDLISKKKFIVQFEYRHRRNMIYIFLVYICSKEKVGQDVNKTISNLPKRRRWILTIYVDPVALLYFMFEEG